MKLYYSPFACSLAPHIACREAGLDVELVRVELSSKRAESGNDLFAANPMGQVPILVLDDGRILTENVAVLSYLADRGPKAAAAPTPVPVHVDGYELTRWLAFVSTEVHKKVLWPIYNAAPDAVKEFARSSGDSALGLLATRLESRATLPGGDFTVADAYLFWALTLMPHAGVSLERYPTLRGYHERHRSRPAVRAALRYEKEQLEKPFAAA